MAGRSIRTMEEFSVASGVSRSTLSRFFADPDSVRPASRVRIEEAIKRFGYRPTLFATNFNRRNSMILGIVVPSLTDPFHAALVQSVERRAHAAGYWSVIQDSQGSPEREAEAVATLLSFKVAGILAIPLGYASSHGLYRDAAGVTPTVFLDGRAEADGPFVGTDNDQSIGLMVDYLRRTGGPPAYFDMPEVNQNARERRRAYEQAMQAHGAEPRVHRVRSRSWEFEQAAFEEAASLIRAGRLLEGTILCANDRIAFGVMAATAQAGVPVGRMAGLRVAGHDDHPLSRYACPGLTTVAQNRENLASLGLALLLRVVGGETVAADEHRLAATLVMRDSA